MGVLGTASLEQKLLDRGASIDEFLATYMLAAETELRERGDAASGALDRERFVRICLSVQAIFLEVLPSWPWRPGAREEMYFALRANKGRESAEELRKWMQSTKRTAEAAREEEAGPSPGYGASD